MQQLEQYSPFLNQQQKDQLFTDNFQTLNQTLQFIGASVLSSVQLAGESAELGSSPTNTQYVGNFVSSGGLIVFLGAIPVNLAVEGEGTLTVTLKLLIDGKTVATGMTVLENSNDISEYVMQTIPLFFAGNYTAGTHTVAIQASASGPAGSFTASVGSTVNTGYYIIEVRNP